MSHGTYKKYMLASSLLCLASSALANVNNASFESWSANTPASWSTIDSGISLSANSNVVYQVITQHKSWLILAPKVIPIYNN